MKGDRIPLFARILSAADAWDAMLSDRPYRKRLTISEAKAELIKNAGTQFDPRVVAALLQCVDSEKP